MKINRFILIICLFGPCILRGEPTDYAVVENRGSHGIPLLLAEDYRLDFKHPFELQARGGISHVILKMERERELTIAYLGGSITMAENGWRPRFTRWLRKEYPEVKITEVNAAINGTGADFGAARLGQDVLKYKPDLLFVEFVVNGGDAGVKDGLERAIEGIVRQTRITNARTDIIFVNTLLESQIKGYLADGPPKIPAAAQAHEKVADYYGIPSISLGCQIGALSQQGQLVGKSNMDLPGKIVFSRDGVHPTDDGAQLYAGAVVRSWLKLKGVTKNPADRSPLREPLHQDNWEGAKLYAPTYAKTSGSWNWHTMDTQSPHYASTFPESGQNVGIIKSMFPMLLGTQTPGSSLTIKFRGTIVGLVDVGGPFSGQLLAEIDGAPPVVVSRFGSYNRHLRQQYFFLPELREGSHEVKFTLDHQMPDKSGVSESIHQPKQYQRNEFYLGNIIIVGEGVESEDTNRNSGEKR